MSIYSYSKIETFEKCKLKFKYRYIDKIIPDIPKNIEAHLGTAVHATLEWFYQQVINKKIPVINEIIEVYSNKWIEGYSPDISIVNKELTIQDYFNKGVEFLVTYYMKNYPFKDNTIAVEERIDINLDEIKGIKIIGFIDRLVHNIEANEIEVHDYKTANTLPLKEDIENSKQLALYSIAMKELFGKNKNVCMIWHFLAHDIKFCLRKTNEELDKLKKEILELIDKIESTKDFPASPSRLCDWCEYKNICTAIKGQKQLIV